MKASEFIQTYAKRGYNAWEAAAVDMFRSGQVPANAWVPITLSAQGSDGKVHSAIAQVSADYLTVGEGEDTLRLPLTPKKAQEILNLDGSLLPTPWLVYQIWRQSVRIPRQGMVPNKGADLAQYAAHNAIINEAARKADWRGDKPLSGGKKDVVISNLYKPGSVVIFGWYRPEPDVFNDKLAWNDPSPQKQPQQAHSNFHGEGYVDYSHGIRKVHPRMVVDGVEMNTEDVYRDPVLSALVSHEGPVRTTRYVAPNPPKGAIASMTGPSTPLYPVFTTPGYAARGYSVMVENYLNKKVS